jgi:hypothetical protein
MTHVSAIYRGVEHMSATKAAATGGAGAGISVAAAVIDPGSVAPWLHVATLCVGGLTGLASFLLVVLKIVQQWRAMRSG